MTMTSTSPARPARERIGVIGAGLMGHGIAQVFAVAGHAVRLTDSHPETLAAAPERIRGNLAALGQDAAAADRVRLAATVAETVADADFVVEAVSEDLAVKRAVFAAAEAAAPAGCILASNTSVIPIGAVMADIADRSRTVGTHWFNPPFLVPLVEVIETPETAPATVARTLALHRAAGKTAVHVRRDLPGFIGNRLQHALWREAIALVEAGVCDAETVDTVVKAGFGRRLAVLGPLENADLVGTDLTLAIHHIVLADLCRATGPSPYLERLVEEGHLGMKTGQGFRRWDAASAAAVRDGLRRHLQRALEAERDAAVTGEPRATG
jgi:3-hydroxybutyryl-CoA dehydrogenase